MTPQVPISHTFKTIHLIRFAFPSPSFPIPHSITVNLLLKLLFAWVHNLLIGSIKSILFSK